MMYPISKLKFEQALAGDSYFEGRWPYYQEAIHQVMQYNPASVLELGCATLPLFLNSTTMDITPACHPTVLHDASQTPWPVADKAFDVFMALQVWEHLGASQTAAFEEVKRISNIAVISFPLLWTLKDPSAIHASITMDRIAEWTQNTPPEKVVIMPPWSHKRAIYVFDFRPKK